LNFAATLENFGTQSALILPGEGVVSYAQLARDCDNFSADLPPGKQLLLIETRNDYPSILAYLAGLRRGDAVMLLDAELGPQLKDQLLAAYQPELIWRREQDGYRLHAGAHSGNTPLHAELALLLSTSGSTGSPKCVRLTLNNLASNAAAIATYLELTPSERAITLLPLHYTYGLSILNSHLAVGAAIVVQQQGILDKGFWQTMREEQVTSLSGVPFIYETLSKIRFAGMPLPALRYLTQAGGRLTPVLVEEFARLCSQRDWRFYVMYGQTEATARISYLPPDKALRKPGSIGTAIPGGKLLLRDEQGREISGPEQAGEMIYLGANVMLGYAEGRGDLHRGDELHGILETGDIARYDADGDLYLVGRKKRFIKLFGQRFGLDEIECRLRSRGLTAACGGRDDHLEIIVEGEHDLAELRKALAAEYRVHSKAIRVASLAELPKTSSGKIDYANLFAGGGNG
jgi:acyl-coenzyme A synthetase/AMP-(fatty) acid ligase